MRIDNTTDIIIFKQRCFNTYTFYYRKSHSNISGNLHTTDHYFSISHSCVYITQRKNRSIMEYREIKSCTLCNPLIVHISTMIARCPTIYSSAFWCYTYNSNHRLYIKYYFVIKVHLTVFHLQTLYRLLLYQRAKHSIVRKCTHHTLIFKLYIQYFNF